MGGGGSSSPKPTPNTSQEKAAAEVALKRYQRYMQVYRPLEVAALKDVTGAAAGNRLVQRAQGMTNADAAQTMAAAQPARGMDPSGQQAQGIMADPTRAAAIASAAAEQAGLARRQKLGGLASAINIGTGQARDAQLGFNALAGSSLQRAIAQQEQKFNERSSKLNTVGSAIGAAGAIGENIFGNRNT